MSSQEIGRYEIKSQLGRGGMAMVYLAFDPRFKRDVAIKVLPREFLNDPSFRSRFDREAQIIASLEHAAIVPVYDFGENTEAGQPYIVMRYMPGGSLAERLNRSPLSLEEAALDKAHGKNIIHRDLKPGNILFDDDGDPCVSDFGIAKIAEATTQYTGTGIVGTPAYISPEQARGERTLDRRSDVYALGCMLFQMLAGRPPYEGDAVTLLYQHVHEPPPDVLEARSDLPESCKTVIERAMAKNRDERYPTAGELSRDVMRLTGEKTGKFARTAAGAGAQTAIEIPTPAPPTELDRAPAVVLASTPTPQREASHAQPAPARSWIAPVVMAVILFGVLALGGGAFAVSQFFNFISRATATNAVAIVATTPAPVTGESTSRPTMPTLPPIPTGPPHLPLPPPHLLQARLKSPKKTAWFKSSSLPERLRWAVTPATATNSLCTP